MYVCVIAKGSTKAVEPFAFSLPFSSRRDPDLKQDLGE